jgi:hypothetical protein
MHRTFRHFACAAALTAASALSTAQAADVIDFESLDLSGLYLPGDSFTSGSYILSVLGDFGIIDFTGALGSQGPSGNATQFYFNSNAGSLSLARGDGAAFNLLGFDAAFVALDPPASQTTVIVATGTTSGGATVSAWWSFAGSNTSSFPFTTNASSLGDLVSVTFKACSLVAGVTCTEPTLNNGQFAIDNIQLAPVPEPTPALLLTLGLVGLGLRARRAAR